MNIGLKGTDTIIIEGDPDRTNISAQDDVMRQLSDLLGVKVTGVTISGYWIIYVDGVIVSGDKLLGQRRYRSFSKALANGLNRTVVTTVSL